MGWSVPCINGGVAELHLLCRFTAFFTYLDILLRGCGYVFFELKVCISCGLLVLLRANIGWLVLRINGRHFFCQLVTFLICVGFFSWDCGLYFLFGSLVSLRMNVRGNSFCELLAKLKRYVSFVDLKYFLFAFSSFRLLFIQIDKATINAVLQIACAVHVPRKICLNKSACWPGPILFHFFSNEVSFYGTPAVCNLNHEGV